MASAQAQSVRKQQGNTLMLQNETFVVLLLTKLFISELQSTYSNYKSTLQQLAQKIGDVEQVVKKVVKNEGSDKENHRNGRRRRRTLITGSQPLPSPLNATFNRDNLFPSPKSHSSLNAMLHDSKSYLENFVPLLLHQIL